MFGIAVAAVASLNVKIANNIQERNNAMSLVNLENITEAQECISVKVEHMPNSNYLHIETNSCNKTIIVTEYEQDGSIKETYNCDGNNYNECIFVTSGQTFKGIGNKL